MTQYHLPSNEEQRQQRTSSESQLIFSLYVCLTQLNLRPNESEEENTLGRPRSGESSDRPLHCPALLATTDKLLTPGCQSSLNLLPLCPHLKAPLSRTPFPPAAPPYSSSLPRPLTAQ